MTSLALPQLAIDRLVESVRDYGERPVETGAFLLATSERPDSIEMVALAGTVGIIRARDFFQVRPQAVERLFAWASERELTIRAQVHSHRRAAFLSRTDLEHGFNVEGFITSVIPEYSDPPATPDLWGWWCHSDGAWREVDAPTSTLGTCEILEFGSDGVCSA